jgi:hypothetical protein
MEPVIPSGSRVMIEPVDVERLELGDIVAVKLGDDTMLHLVKAIDRDQHELEISGTSGPSNGWTSFERVRAICTQVQGRTIAGSQRKRRRRFARYT